MKKIIIFKDGWLFTIANNVISVFNIIFDSIKSFWKHVTKKDSNGDSWFNLFLTGIVFVILFWVLYSVF